MFFPKEGGKEGSYILRRLTTIWNSWAIEFMVSLRAEFSRRSSSTLPSISPTCSFFLLREAWADSLFLIRRRWRLISRFSAALRGRRDSISFTNSSRSSLLITSRRSRLRVTSDTSAEALDLLAFFEEGADAAAESEGRFLLRVFSPTKSSSSLKSTWGLEEVRLRDSLLSLLSE